MSEARRFLSLEALIIDEVVHLDADGVVTARHDDQIGGSGIYAMIGARMFLEPERLGMMVSYTEDSLPSWMKERLESYGSQMWCFKHRQDGGGTCRSIQTYQNGARRESLLDYLLFNPLDLLQSPFADPLPTTIHAVSFIERTRQILTEFRQLSTEHQTGWPPTFIWEPYYAESIPQNWVTFKELVPQVAIFSPNHVEALKLCDIPMPAADQLGSAVERACVRMAQLRPQLATIIRAGSLGACYTLTSEPDRTHWIPAYWTDSAKVVDPTGAGNGFMGGLSAALDSGLDITTAVKWGTISASFIVQQAGLPTVKNGLWNGETVRDRLDKLEKRIEGRGVSA